MDHFCNVPNDVLRRIFEIGGDLFPSPSRHLRSTIPRFPCPRSDEKSIYAKELECLHKYHSFCSNVTIVNKRWFSLSADLRFRTLFLSGNNTRYEKALKKLQIRIGPDEWFPEAKRAGLYVEHLDLSFVYASDALMTLIPQILHACATVEFLTVRIERSTSLLACQLIFSEIMTTVGRRLKQLQWYVPIASMVPLCIGNYISVMSNLCYLDLHDEDWYSPEHLRYVYLPNLHTLRLHLRYFSLMTYFSTWGIPSIKTFIFACRMFKFLQPVKPLYTFFRIHGAKLRFLELENIPEDPQILEAILEECPNVHDLNIDMTLSTELDGPLPFPSIQRLGILGSSVYDVPIYISELVTLMYEEQLFLSCNEIRLLEYNRVNLKTCYSIDSAHILIKAIDSAERLQCERRFSLLDNDGVRLQKKDVYIELGGAGVFVPYTTGVTPNLESESALVLLQPNAAS